MTQGAAGIDEVDLSGSRDIDGILWGYRWEPVASGVTNLTYSFPGAPGAYGSYQAINGFEAFDAGQQAAINTIIANFNGVSGLNITLGGDAANIRFAEATTLDYGDAPGTFYDLHRPGGANDSAEGIAPDSISFPGYAFGDTWYNHTTYNAPVAGDFAYAAGLMHEIGHALGLAHGHATQTIRHEGHTHTKPTLPPDHDSQEYSIMTYSRYTGGSEGGSQAAEYPQTLMMNDIAALQYLYGADYNYRSGSTRYSWSTTTGEMSIDGVGQGAPAGNFVFLTIWDGGGVDTYDFSNQSANLIVDLNPGAWTTLAAGQLAALGHDGANFRTARGSIANALLFGGNGASLIENAVGGGGHDGIAGNFAANLLSGGGGRDTLNGDHGADRLDGGAGGDALIGGTGIDTAIYASAGAGLTADLVFAAVGTGEAAGDTYESIENLLGGGFHDILRGHDGVNAIGGGAGGDDRLVGRGGNDTLAGGIGDDRLDGGFGGDFLDGGAGADTAEYSSANARVTVDLVSNLNNRGDASGDSHASIENIDGSGFSDDLRGNNVANILSGGAGGDILDGRGGFDRLVGGAGDDFYFLESLSRRDDLGFFEYDEITELQNGGIDSVAVLPIDNPDTFGSLESYTLGAHIENGIVIGGFAFNLGGNALDNGLIGNGAANFLAGKAGNDRLDGGEGDDTMRGEAGNDTYVLADLVAVPGGFFRYDIIEEFQGEGTDTVQFGLSTTGPHSYTLGANLENCVLLETNGSTVFLRGNELNNALTGNNAASTIDGLAGKDMLNGGLGDDNLRGGAGNDTYVIADLFLRSGLLAYDNVVEAVGEGIDTVRFGLFTSGPHYYTLGANLENCVLLETNGLTVFLTGNTLANALTGNAAANKRDGLGGKDRMAGMAGNDIYVVDHARDIVLEAAGAGEDEVLAKVSYKLAAAAAIEQLATANAAGAQAIALTGNGFAQTITGNAGNNILRGEGANDSIDGLGGADRIYGGAGEDTISGGAGRDRIYFNTALGGGNVDRIADYAAIDDSIWLDRAIFDAIAANGVLAVGAFRVGASANAAANRIIYDSATGSIFYDADGVGGVAQIEFARVDVGTALNRADFGAYSSIAAPAPVSAFETAAPVLALGTTARGAVDAMPFAMRALPETMTPGWLDMQIC